MEAKTVPGVRVEEYDGARDGLRGLFALAEDSAVRLEEYLDAGRVLIARRGGEVIGHLQVVSGEIPGELEINNMAVVTEWQGRGGGAALVRDALDIAVAEDKDVLVVATAAADTGNLRFYQRQGFRMRSVERDAFTAATGYPDRIVIDGIELRDRVWLDLALEGGR